MVIVINSVIEGFNWVDLVRLAASTVRLQVSDHSQLSDYRCPITANCLITLSDYDFTELSVKYRAADAPITFQEILMIMFKKKITR